MCVCQRGTGSRVFAWRRMKVVPFKGRVGRWAIQELRLWEGLYREPTPAGSVRHIKNWSYEGRFLEARRAPPNEGRQYQHHCSPAQDGHHKPTASTASTTAITPADEFLAHPTPLAAIEPPLISVGPFPGHCAGQRQTSHVSPQRVRAPWDQRACRNATPAKSNRTDRSDRHPSAAGLLLVS